jgi:serine/threonine-protein kinase
MKADIDRHLAGIPVQAPAVAAAAATAFIPPTAAADPGDVVDEDEDTDEERKKRGPFILLVLLLIALIAAALIFGPRLFEAAPEQQSVPTVEGLTRAQAESTITDSGLEVGEVTAAASEDIAVGRVISQTPQPGDLVDKGDSVDFVVSTGRPQIALPDVVGRNKDEAADELRGKGLRVVLNQRDVDDPKDEVVQMQPPAGTSVRAGSKVTIFWSDGPEQVPDVRGKKVVEATRMIEEAGFEVSKVNDATTPADKGTVLQQSPSPGQTLDKGSTVTIVVSTYEEPEPTPTPSPPTTPTTPVPSP